MTRWRAALPLLLLIALGGLFSVALRLDPHAVPSPLVNLPAPAFSAARLDDPATSFTREQMLGRVWLLNVWASWCTVCLDEHPALLDFAKRRQITVVGLNYKDKREFALAWLARHGNPYSLSVFDGDGAVGLDWGVYGVPETFVIDAQGVVRFKHVGALTPRVIEEHLEPLLRSLSS